MFAIDHLLRTGRNAVSAIVPRNHCHGAALATLVICGGIFRTASAENPPSIFEWQGTKSEFRFGASMANVGDVDGGGKDDILIGAFEGADPGAGAAFLYRGEDGLEFKKFAGEPGQHRGDDVAAAGDLNGDGVPDILIGSRLPDNAGRVEALSYSRITGAWTTLWSRDGQPNDLLVDSRAIGDIDGGGPDVLIGGVGPNGSKGRVWLVDGTTGLTIRSWEGTQAETSFGAVFDSAPDVDGDGKPEVLIGAPLFDTGPSGVDAGRVFLYSGAKDNVLIRTWDGQAGDNLGTPIQRGPDVDHDGFDDLLVGAGMTYPYPTNTGAGKACIYSIQTGALLKTWNGTSSGDRTFAVGRVGDVNGDGVEDIAVGSPNFDGPAGVNAGKLDVYSGKDLSRRLCTVHGTQSNETLSAPNSAPNSIYAGDLNSDGYAEFAVSADFYDGTGLSNSGHVRVIAGDVFTPGVTKYGNSKNFCTGQPIPLSVTSPLTPGSTNFAITAINTPIGSVAVPVIALQSANLHSGWLPILVNFAAPYLILAPVIPTAPGELVLPAIPPAGYVGPQVYMQLFFVDVAGTCAPFGSISGASNGLHL